MNFAHFINTLLQRGDQTNGEGENRFNGFARGLETVETVSRGSRTLDTWLKPGVNELLRRKDSTI